MNKNSEPGIQNETAKVISEEQLVESKAEEPEVLISQQPSPDDQGEVEWDSTEENITQKTSNDGFLEPVHSQHLPPADSENQDDEQNDIRSEIEDQSQQSPSEGYTEPELDNSSTIDTPAISIQSEDDHTDYYFDHSAWQALLTKYVSNSGVVNYAGFKSDESLLDAYLNMLTEMDLNRNDKSRESMATWINAYNAFTVKLILNHYPTSSITKIKDGNPWDYAWINMANEILTLNEIEHKILRVNWDDARIHFAVNCAAQSCPPLSNVAFTAQNLEDELDKLTRSFINNSTFNQINKTQLRLSKIFEWYREDFGDLIVFVNKYSATKANANSSVEFNDYDWKLNGK